ncbi:ATP-binding protein [Xanthomonadaceae bacterium XH05]|nr:ATP-binding protein [Xanthomonadaceae bacterium XH05]
MRCFRPSIVPALALLLAGLAVTGEAWAGESTPRWVSHHYGSVDGLPVGSASSARVDADGFLWLATHDGLARFDGQRFDVHDSMRFPAMSGNRVLSIHKDDEGRLFAHTSHGDWLSIRSGRIERAPMGIDAAPAVLHVDPASLCLTTSRAVHCPDGTGAFPERLRLPEQSLPGMALPGPDGVIWLPTQNGDIWRHDGNQWRRVWQTPEAAMRTSSSNPALVATDGTLWTTTVRGHLLRIAPHGDVTIWSNQAEPQMTIQIREDRQQRVWIGAMNGVFRIIDGKPQRVIIHAPGTAGENSFGIASGSLQGHLSWQAPDDALWLRTGPHLWRFENDEALELQAQAPLLSSRGQILDLLFSADGTTWVLTLRDGIHRLNQARVELLDTNTGLGDGNIYGVSRDRDGTMWLGTLGDGLKSIAADGTLRLHERSDGLPGENPWLVAAAPDGGIYAGTYAPGLWYRAPDASRFEPVALPDELLGEQILAVVFDHEQRMWLGSSAGAWRNTVNGWQRQWPLAPHRARISALAFSADGEVWFGGSEGVWRQHGDQSHAVAVELLAQTSVRDLFRSSDGALWVSTDGRGLVRVAGDDPHGHKAIRLGRAQGLPSNSPHAVREDANGHIWVNSNQGIFRIAHNNLHAHLADTGQRLSPLVLGLADGLTELEGNGGVQPAGDFDARGRLWFPSQRGVVRFDPLTMPLREDPPRAVIDALESDGQPLLFPTSGNTLPPGVRSLLIRYGAADLHAGAQVRFRYRLLPQDRGWTDATNGRAAGYARLTPGDYRFELLAGNSDGVWATTPIALDFHVPPRWYETGTFRWMLALTGMLLVAGAMRWRVHSLRQRAAALNREVSQRTGELLTEKARVESALSDLSRAHTELAQTHAQIEDRNQQLAEQARRLEAMDRFRTRVLADVSHELRTPVMLVSLPLRELQAQSSTLGDTERRRLQLSLTQLDRLGGLVEQLVGLVQAESGQLQPRLRRLDLRALLEEIVAGYQPSAARNGATLALQAPDDAMLLFADRDHLLTIFGNLTDNAIKYAPSGGHVLLRLVRDGDLACVDVQDNGPGFDQAVTAHLFERFYRVDGPPRHGREGLGIGLALARELVELHGGRISASSVPGTGATFRVELPLGSAHIAINELVIDDRAVAAPVNAAPTQRRGEGRVLLVEDHPDLAAYLAERIGDHLPVTWVDSAERALDVLAEEHDIQLLISDVMLPGASGLELCRHVRDGVHPLPVLLISAKAADGDRAAGLDAGASAYLAKPFSFEDLLDAIARAWPAAGWRLSPAPAAPESVDPLLTVALEGMIDTEFSIATWADRVHLSERQLRRRVHELTGQSPQIWLREQRLLRVRHLLRNGECKTLAEAGSRCGLDNPSYLYRSYRARFGD